MQRIRMTPRPSWWQVHEPKMRKWLFNYFDHFSDRRRRYDEEDIGVGAILLGIIAFPIVVIIVPFAYFFYGCFWVIERPFVWVKKWLNKEREQYEQN